MLFFIAISFLVWPVHQALIIAWMTDELCSELPVHPVVDQATILPDFGGFEEGIRIGDWNRTVNTKWQSAVLSGCYHGEMARPYRHDNEAADGQ